MKKRNLLKICLFGCIVLGIIVLGWFWWRDRGVTHVVFLDVGQGDAILIRQGSTEILIDGGREGKELLSRLGRHVPFWDRSIEVVIATHPDADHIGGLAMLARTYRIGRVLETGAESETDFFVLWHQALEKKEVPRSIVFRGTRIALPEGGEFTVEYPQAPLPKDMEETNEGSIVSRFVFGETSFLLTGDLPREESFLPEETPITVLKAAHHGSRFSTSDTFLDMVRPKEAVISVGKNNYGHPATEVLERLAKHGVGILRTDVSGDIEYRCTNALQGCVLVH